MHGTRSQANLSTQDAWDQFVAGTQMDTSVAQTQAFNIDPVFSTADPVAAAQQAQQQAIAQKRDSQATAAAAQQQNQNGSSVDAKGDLNQLPHLSSIFTPSSQQYQPAQQQQGGATSTNGGSH